MKLRRQIEEEPENHDRWLVSYADFITLLFAFFTVLYATSERDLEKTKEFQESVKQYLVKAGAFGGSGDQVNQGEKYNSPIEPPIKTFQSAPTGARELQAKITSLIEAQMTQEQIDKMILDISSDDYGARVVLAGDQVFEIGNAKMKVTAFPVLNLLTGILLNLNQRVVVEGHSQVGTAAEARQLSSLRSNQLIKFFLRKAPEKDDQFISIALGNQRPLNEKGSGASPRFNERIEVRILSDDSPF